MLMIYLFKLYNYICDYGKLAINLTKIIEVKIFIFVKK